MEQKKSQCVFEHPRLGSVRGLRCSDKISQFLGLQYGTLTDRFSRGTLVESPSSVGSGGGNAPAVILDATKFGPTPLLPPNNCQNEQNLVQKSLPSPMLDQSDIQCLTLNLTVPLDAEAGALPVLVFVHGGGYGSGSSSFPQNDLARITELSASIKAPMISVGVNYRVGLPGFLYSREMRATGYKPNNGLYDQRLALCWVKDNIVGFGGDPDRVTFLGESAGASSGFYHLHARDPLFSQFIAMGGTSLLRPRPLQAVQTSFRLISELLAASDLDPQRQLDILLTIPPDELAEKVGRKFVVGPVVDEDFIPTVTTYNTLKDKSKLLKLYPGMQKCKRLLIGDCQMDGMIWSLHIPPSRADVLSKTLAKCLTTAFDPIDTNLANNIISAYGLDTSATANTRQTTHAVFEFGNDVAFLLPAINFQKAWSESSIPGSTAFIYHFNSPNPWDGPWKGYATHDLDLMFALQNYHEHLAAGQQKCGQRFAQDIITFVYGKDPWLATSPGETQGSMVYDASVEGKEDESVYVADGSPSRTQRRTILQNLVKEEHYDPLFEAWLLFMRGPQR